MRWWVLVTLMCGAACEAPEVFATQGAPPRGPTARIEGQVTVFPPRPGNVVLFLFEADHPPPPRGTGRPVSFTVLRESEVFNKERGPYSAPFTFSLVPPGRYLISGIVDPGADFVPWYSVTAEPNQGDVGSTTTDVVEVLTAPDGQARPATGVHVLFEEAAPVFPDRPLFRTPFAELQLSRTQDPTVLELTPEPVARAAIQQPQPVLLAKLVDDNGDGIPDDADQDGTPDFWPKVTVRKLSAHSRLLEENDLNRDGQPDASGPDYEHTDSTLTQTIAADGIPDVVVLAASVHPEDVLPSLIDGQGSATFQPVSISRMRVLIRPVAYDVSDPSRPVPLKRVPAGEYAVIVRQYTGQSWRLPNELSPQFAPGLQLPPVESQGFVVRISEP